MKTKSYYLQGTLLLLTASAHKKLDTFLKVIHARWSDHPQGAALITVLEEEVALLLGYTATMRSSLPLRVTDVTQVIKQLSAPKKKAALKLTYTPIPIFYRMQEDRWLLGVAGGLGNYWRVPAWIFRVGFIAATSVGGLGFLMYMALATTTPLALTLREKIRARGLPITETTILAVAEKSQLEEAILVSKPSSLPVWLRTVALGVEVILRTVGILCSTLGAAGALSLTVISTFLWYFEFSSQQVVWPTFGQEFFHLFTNSELQLLIICCYLFLLTPTLILSLIGLSLVRLKNMLTWSLVLPLLLLWFISLTLLGGVAVQKAPVLLYYASSYLPVLQ